MATMQSPPGAEAVIDGRRYLYFAGTAYYGLQGHPEVIAAACRAAERYGLGSATTRAWFGDMPPTLDVERCAAGYFAADAAFYYVSGYVGTQVLFGALAGEFAAVFVDELSHYSLIEAARATGRPVIPFAHRNPDELKAKLRKHTPAGARPLVATDGVFPVLGAIAPVGRYRDVLAAFPGSALLIDAAPGLGVLGAHGRGTFEHCLPDTATNVDLSEVTNDAGPHLFWSGTLSKAFGGFGGIVAGSSALVQRVKRGSHYFDGASALPPPVAAAAAKGLELLDQIPQMREQLWANVRSVKRGLAGLGLPTDDTPVPIICLKPGGPDDMRRIQGGLMERGIMIAYAASYSGLGPGGALRLAVCCLHTEAMIAQLLDAMAELL